MPSPAWTLGDWLAWQERLHPNAIELGLDRSRAVAERAGLLPPAALTATIAGTNGKGSATTLAATIWQCAGHRVGRYTSPHLRHYAERIAIDGQPVDDAALCRAFAAIESARADVPLTYFEFGTLAALWLFREAQVDVQVLEVGLGGRLDAVNIVDADAALITSIGLDHLDWLGPDRESIGREKAGVYRRDRPAICADPAPPASIGREAERIAARFWQVGRDYHVIADGPHWHWRPAAGPTPAFEALPRPALPGAFQIDNAGGVLALVTALADRLPVSRPAIEQALRTLQLPGRMQRSGRHLLDVAHNAEAAGALAAVLAETRDGVTRTTLVIGMLADKPVAAVVAALAGQITHACCVTLPPPRGLPAERLAQVFADCGVATSVHPDVASALSAAERQRPPADRIVVTGSFLTVTAALEHLE